MSQVPEAAILLVLAMLLACSDGSGAAAPPVAQAKAPAQVAPAPSSASASAPRRVVAVGDLHGDLQNALAALELAGVIDESGRWSGGDTVLVQTGDTTDRGPDSKPILDLLRRLSKEAAAAGGRVVALVGNHEAMNMVGDWRYVHPGDVEAFGGQEPRRKAFAPDGEYGAWLVERGIVAAVGDAVFVHAGITPDWAAKGVDGINAAAREALTTGRGAVLGPDGPIWFRGFVQEPEAVACPALNRSLEALGVRRMVVGHTTRRDGRIQERCDGRLYVIDVGIAAHYGGHVGVLEILDGDARALYPSGSVDLEDPR